MGMFDYVRCEYPLPDKGANDALYQTKDTDEQYLETYVITEDGRLLDPQGKDTEFHGDLNFYASNWAGYSPAKGGGTLLITCNDDPWEAWDYVARFTDGKLAKLTGGINPIEDHIRHVTHEEWAQLTGR